MADLQTKIAAAEELERRGKLTPEQSAALAELKRRSGAQEKPGRHPAYQAARDLGGAVVNATKDYVGRRGEREAGIPELSSIDVGRGAGLVEGTLRNMQVGAGFFASPDPTAREGIVQSAVPGTTFRTDESGYRRAVLPDGREAYLNAPGPSADDITTLIGEGVKYAGGAAAGAKVASRGAARLAGQAAAAGGVSVAGDKLAQLLGSEEPVSGARAGLAALFGVGAEGIAMGGRMLRPNQQRAEMLRRGTEELDEIGSSPTASIPTVGADTAAERAAAAEAFGVRTTVGQASRNPAELGRESDMMRGGKGPHAAQTLKDAAIEQARAVREAGNSLSGARVAQDVNEAGSRVAQGLRSVDDDMRAATNAAYEEARGLGAQLDTGGSELSGQALRARISAGLAERGIYTDTAPGAAAFPATRQAIDYIDDVFGRLAQQPLPFEAVETLRSVVLSAQRGAKGPDKVALGVVLKELDDEIATLAQMGDLQAFQGARATARERLGLFQPSSPSDLGGKIVRKVLDQDLSADQAVRAIFGAAATGTSQSAPAAARRIRQILEPRDPEGFQALKDAYVSRLMGSQTAEGSFSYGQLIKAWDEALNGKNAAVTAEMFSEAERAAMRKYLGLLKILHNSEYRPSAPGIQQALESGLKRTLAGIAAAKGGPAGAAATYAGVGAVRELGSRAGAARAVAGPAMTPRRPVPDVSGGLAGSARQLQEYEAGPVDPQERRR